MKKIILIAALSAITTVLFAQESLKDFLDAINEINNQKIELQGSHNFDYDSEVYRIRKAAQEELAYISKLEQEPWEDDDDFNSRIDELISKTTEKMNSELKVLKSKAENDSKGKAVELEIEKKKLISRMEQKQFVYSGESVNVSFGNFEKTAKYWPVTIKSLEEQLNYTGSFIYEIDKSFSIGEQYMKIDNLVKDNLLTAEIYFRVVNRAPNANSYQKEVQKVVLYGPNNEVLKTYEVNQVVDTFTLYQTVYEESSVYNY